MNHEGLHEAERYNTTTPQADRLLNTLKIHNPSVEVPLAEILAHVPPSFIVCAGPGDKVHALWAVVYFQPMLERGVPNLEMHFYGNGGPGGSIGERGGTPFGTWPARYLDWLRDLGFLDERGRETNAARDVAAFARQQGE